MGDGIAATVEGDGGGRGFARSAGASQSDQTSASQQKAELIALITGQRRRGLHDALDVQVASHADRGSTLRRSGWAALGG